MFASGYVKVLHMPQVNGEFCMSGTEDYGVGPKKSTACMRVAEVASELRVSPGMVYKLVREGKIAHLKIGDRVIIPRSALDALLASAA